MCLQLRASAASTESDRRLGTVVFLWEGFQLSSTLLIIYFFIICYHSDCAFPGIRMHVYVCMCVCVDRWLIVIDYIGVLIIRDHRILFGSLLGECPWGSEPPLNLQTSASSSRLTRFPATGFTWICMAPVPGFSFSLASPACYDILPLTSRLSCVLPACLPPVAPYCTLWTWCLSPCICALAAESNLPGHLQHLPHPEGYLVLGYHERDLLIFEVKLI